MQPHERIIVALDVPTLTEAQELVRLLRGHVGMFKVGLQLLHSVGTPIVLQMLKDEGVEVMLDLKLDDIPNTMQGAMEAITPFNPKFVTIHASSGPDSIQAAVGSRGGSGILGVTVLTSFNPIDCVGVFGGEPAEVVVNLSKLLERHGAQGVVCSPMELERIRHRDLLKVVPGIRPLWSVRGDQARAMTPSFAMIAGADYLVIGRPITSPPEEIEGPVMAAGLIAEEIRNGLKVTS